MQDHVGMDAARKAAEEAARKAAAAAAMKAAALCLKAKTGNQLFLKPWNICIFPKTNK